MPRKRNLTVGFPLGGLDRSRSYRQQKPYTTKDCLNVRPVGTVDKRNRGGSRPGLVNSHLEDHGGSIRMLYPMVFNPEDDYTYFSDTFDGTAMSGSWTAASWATGLPSVSSGLASGSYSAGLVGGVISQLSINTAVEYDVEMYIIPYNGAFHGKYQLYLRLDNTTPAYTTAGVLVELTMTGTTGAWTGKIESYVAGVLTTVDSDTGTKGSANPGWFIAKLTGTTLQVYWDGELILSGTIGAQTGVRAGFGLQCTVSGGLASVGAFRLQHWFSDSSTSEVRTMLILASDGDIWKENWKGGMAEVSSDLSIRSDVQLAAAQSGTDLYIADYGNLRASGSNGVVSGATLDSATYADWTTLSISTYDDVVVVSSVGGSTVAGTYKIQSVAAGAVTLTSSPGDGTCSFRIERAPKKYDPLSATPLSIWTATTGQVPTGCPLICRAMDRLFLAGADAAPHVWYCSRQSDETDWDYSQTDSQRAVAGTSAKAGVPGDPITALLAHSDDYVIMGCLNSIWRMRGDPAYGGSLTALSHSIGIIDKKSWCFGPNGELIFLSLDGVYMLSPGGDSFPTSVSRELLPAELTNLDPNSADILLEFDVAHRGVHIFISPTTAGSSVHWWLDWTSKTFWPVTVNSNYEPTAICQHNAVTSKDGTVILGGRDGRLRRFSDFAERDCGTVFTNYVDIGPLPLGNESEVGVLQSLDAVIGLTSGNVTWTVKPALTAESTGSASTYSSGTWVAGLNATNRRLARGQSYVLRITGGTGRRWELEAIEATIESAGRRRIS